VLEQQPRRREVTTNRRRHERRQPGQVRGVHVRTPIEQQRRDIVVPVRRCDDERSVSSTVARVERRARDEQRICRTGVSAVGRVEQRFSLLHDAGHLGRLDPLPQ
jgi:hypothetical protein